MLAKGCIVSEAEQHKKSMLYRLRTASNATLDSNPKVPDDPGNTEQEPQSILPLGMSSIYLSSQGKGLFCNLSGPKNGKCMSCFLQDGTR